MSKDLQKILFAVDSRGYARPLFASGQAVEWQVYDDSETDWDDVVDGVPASPGLYVWEGNPHPCYETDDYSGKEFVYQYTYDADSWRLPDALEWLSIQENVCPWASMREPKQEEPEQEMIQLTGDRWGVL